MLPNHYALELEPDLAQSSFQGQVIIDLEVVEETDTIVLNAAELTRKCASRAGALVQASSISFDEDLERATFTFPVVLQPGPAKLSCSFTGSSTTSPGVYRSTWTDEEGNEKVIATTSSSRLMLGVSLFRRTGSQGFFRCTLRVDVH